MPNTQVEKAVFRFYDFLWKAAIPLLRKNDRMSEGFLQRNLEQPALREADLWIQSASAGEAYLAVEILRRLKVSGRLRILFTTNTRQGMDILRGVADDPGADPRRPSVTVAYFPFDRPSLMKKAVDIVRPRVMVLLESELWPGLLLHLKQAACRVLIINGRITPGSLSRYLVWPSLWRRLRPDGILAISDEDAQRFARLFGRKGVGVMPNIKFDRLDAGSADVPDGGLLDRFLPDRRNFLILGSVRREEESRVEKIIERLLREGPGWVVGLFPRHMHRVAHWKAALSRLGVPWRLRSQIDSGIPGGTVILWDVFGELGPAFRKAGAAFVGGSLAPLGGQNFLEPLICGITPVVGPYWDNFKWVGAEITREGLVREASTWKEVANILIEVIMNESRQETVRQRALAYIQDRRGGTDMACRLIAEHLQEQPDRL